MDPEDEQIVRAFEPYGDRLPVGWQFLRSQGMSVGEVYQKLGLCLVLQDGTPGLRFYAVFSAEPLGREINLDEPSVQPLGVQQPRFATIPKFGSEVSLLPDAGPGVFERSEE